MSQQWIRRNPAVGFLFPALTRPKRSIGSTTAPHIQPVVPEPTSEWLVAGEVVLTKILTHLSSKNQRWPLWNPQTSTNWLTKQKHGSLSSHQLRPSKTGLKNNEDDADCSTCVLRSLAQLISPLPLHQQCGGAPEWHRVLVHHTAGGTVSLDKPHQPLVTRSPSDVIPATLLPIVRQCVGKQCAMQCCQVTADEQSLF